MEPRLIQGRWLRLLLSTSFLIVVNSHSLVSYKQVGCSQLLISLPLHQSSISLVFYVIFTSSVIFPLLLISIFARTIFMGLLWSCFYFFISNFTNTKDNTLFLYPFSCFCLSLAMANIGNLNIPFRYFSSDEEISGTSSRTKMINP